MVTAVPLCLYIGAELWREAQQAEQQARQLVLSIAATAAATTRTRLREAQFFAAALARRPLVRALDSTRCDPLLESLLPLLPHYANISVLWPDGQFVCSAVPISFSGQRTPLHEGITGALDGYFSLSRPLVGVLPEKLMISAAYPIRGNEGTVEGVLTIPIDLTSIQVVSDAMALPKHVRVHVIDRNGVLLASSSVNDPDLGRDLRGSQIVGIVLGGESGSALAHGTDGVQRIYGYVPVGTEGWHAYAGVPVSELLAAAQRRTLTSALIAAALLVCSLIAAALVARRIATPIAALRRAMDETAAGRAAYADEAGTQEVQALARNYNRMLDAIRAAQRALGESEARLRLAVRASHTGLWDWEVENGRVYYSTEWKRQLGYGEEEVSGYVNEWADRLHPEERERVLVEQRQLFESGGSHYEGEFRLRHKDGTYRWIYSRAEVMRDDEGVPRRMLGTHVDITSRKNLEQALQRTIGDLRKLSMRMIEVEAHERRSIGRELHDRTGANLAALHMILGRLAEKVSAGTTMGVAALVAEARELLAQMSTELRDVMAELRPAALDDFGLYPALQSHAREVASRLGVELHMHGDAPEPRLPPVVETALFRIAQEALTNIGKHACASRIDISLEERADSVALHVADNGGGFDASDDASRDGHGLRTMRERAEAIGAVLTVRSAAGTGTRVTVELPRP
jgi:two-component system sensor histidine kinase UhpB